MYVFRLQASQMFVTLFVYLEVRLEIFPQCVHQQFLPVQISVGPITELLHGSAELLKLDNE